MVCLLIGLLYTLIYAGVHAIFIYPTSSRVACGTDSVQTNRGRLESLTYTPGIIPWIVTVHGYLVCGDDDTGVDMTLPIRQCPSVFTNDEILVSFIGKYCLPIGVAREAVDRLTVKPDDDGYPAGSLVLYTHPWDQSPETTKPIYSVRDAPLDGNFYVQLRSPNGTADPQFYEGIDSFIERIYRNASLPTTEQLRTNGLTTILHRVTLSASQWLNYVEYNKGWQRLVYTVLMQTSGELAECCVCLDERTDPGPKDYVNCGHCFHTSCIQEWISISGKNECPLCRARNIVIP